MIGSKLILKGELAQLTTQGKNASESAFGDIAEFICAHEGMLLHEGGEVIVRKNYPNAMNRKFLAEAVRFELTEDSHPRQFSRLLHSTALPRFQAAEFNRLIAMFLSAMRKKYHG